MSAEIKLMISLSLILLISPFLSNKFKFPISVVEIVLGIIFGAFHLIDHNNHYFKLLAEVGFLFLMLLAGMEVNLKELLRLDKSIIKKGIMFLVLLYTLAFLIVFLSSLSFIYVIVFSLISVGLLLSIQQEIGKTPWLDLAIKIGVLGELLSILLLTILSEYLEYSFSKELLINILILIGVLVLMGVVFVLFRTLLWWYPNLKHSLMPGIDKYHQDVRIAMSLFFIMIAVMMILKIDVVLGAFVVGVFLRTFFDHNHKLEHKLAPLGFGFLITIFFVHVGSSIDLSKLSFDMIKDILILTSIMIGIRIASSFVFVKDLGVKGSVLFGLSLSMPLTLLIATATLAKLNHYIDEREYIILVITSVLEVIIVMFGVKFINKLKFQKKDN
jgi:Kef-type K+ transport system membrane component KefB